MPDQVRFENYELLRREDGSVFELGRGAMGVTYKAFDTDLHCNVALKVINPGILGNTDIRERFLREARAAARLRHPNIASVFRLGRTPDDTYFYAMEFCEGPTLAQAVAQRGVLPADEAVSIAWQVSKALILAEENQLLHRDLKPSNLILTERSDEGVVVKVIDFGLAKSFADGQQSLATTGPGGFVGTAQFASPEQLEEKELDIRSDIYSLGACLWFMLTGKPQFEGSLARVMSHTLTSEPAWDTLAGQPEPVVALLRRMLAKDRAKRPPSAVALKQEFEACYESLGAVIPGSDFRKSTPPPAKSLDEAGFNARFAISKRIGQDAMGQIFQATDAANNRKPVVVRMLDPGLTVVPTLRRQIEGRIVAAMEHPHPNLLVPLAYAGAAQGFCMAMPQTTGFTLLELLKQRSVLSPSEALRLLEPLARVADFALENKLAGFDLSKEQVAVHFPGGLNDEDRVRVLAEPLDQWPQHEVKVSAISLDDLTSHSDSSIASMMTMAPVTGSNAVFSPVKALANLVCEMLGSVGGTGFAPIARLSEKANAVLRNALTDKNAYPNSPAFFEEFRTAVGRAGNTSVPGIRAASSSTTPLIGSSSSYSFKPLIIGALGLLLVCGLAAGYWFGIHQPREREKRQTEAKAAENALAEKRRQAVAEQERIKAEAENAKAEAERQRLAMEAEANRAKAEAEKAKADLEKTKRASVISTPPQSASQPTPTTVSGDQTLTSPDGVYSIRIIEERTPGGSVIENFTITLFKQGNAISKQPTTGYLMTAYWSTDGKYLAVNNRRGNAGDYVWIFALPSGEVLKRPDDKIGEQWSKEAYRAMEEKNPSLKGAEVHHDWLTVTGWQNGGLQLQLNTNFIRLGAVQFEGIAQPPEWTATDQKVSELKSDTTPAPATSTPQPTILSQPPISLPPAASQISSSDVLSGKWRYVHKDNRNPSVNIVTITLKDGIGTIDSETNHGVLKPGNLWGDTLPAALRNTDRPYSITQRHNAKVINQVGESITIEMDNEGSVIKWSPKNTTQVEWINFIKSCGAWPKPGKSVDHYTLMKNGDLKTSTLIFSAVNQSGDKVADKTAESSIPSSIEFRANGTWSGTLPPVAYSNDHTSTVPYQIKIRISGKIARFVPDAREPIRFEVTTQGNEIQLYFAHPIYKSETQLFIMRVRPDGRTADTKCRNTFGNDWIEFSGVMTKSN